MNLIASNRNDDAFNFVPLFGKIQAELMPRMDLDFR
jgi:hypothetical protein